MRYVALLIVVGLLGGWHWWTRERAVSRPAGVLVAAEPLQQNLDPPRQWDERGYTFIARARYDISARILRKENYHIDGGANIAPVDLAVGWGPMSDTVVIDELEFSQMGRFFYWRPKHGATFPIPADALVTHAAQMHMIPATEEIGGRLKKLRPGQVATLGGYLVDVRGPGAFVWNTSLTRDDTGNGACEIFWAETLSVD